MSQLVETTIEIDGTIIKQFTGLQLKQGIFAHHTFQLVCPAETTDGISDTVVNESHNLIGRPVRIKMASLQENASFLFSGLITQVEMARSHGHAGDVIISGYSPTILLDSGLHCKSWERKPIKNIVQDVLKQFAPDCLKYMLDPASSETLSYMVQYKETAWQFINRLAANYGEWLWYNGKQLILGSPRGNKASVLNHEIYNGCSQDIAGCAGLNDLGKHTLEKSAQLYSVPSKQWHNQFLSSKKQLEDFVNTRAAMQSSDVIQFNGSSDMPGIHPGTAVTIKNAHVFNERTESLGEFTVISIAHNCDGLGNYSNDFIAIPATVKVPPVRPFAEPRCETQSALVVDNHDMKGLGRVRVKFHWMNDDERSPWLRVATPHAGGGKGMFIIPEKGEEVIVGFEGDHAIKPYVIGTVFHGKAKTEFGNKENDIKAIQTRSGNKIIMNDQEGSVQVEDKDGNHIKMDGAGNIRVISKNAMALECGEARIEMKKDGTINISGAVIDVTSNGQTTITAEGVVKVQGEKITLN